MENPEEILHSLEEFSKLRPKSIPRELEDYLCFVAKTGDPVYQWSVIKCLFREKLINVITEFYESCPSVDIPPCRNVDIFNYDTTKTFILEKLDTFVAAPFTVQRICELLTMPRKEYNRIDKYMRALEKNILVVSTTEPGNHRTPENGDGFVNGIDSDHMQDGSNDINIEEMDDGPVWPPKNEDSYQSTSKESQPVAETIYNEERENNIDQEPATSSQSLETVICGPSDDHTFVPTETANEITPEPETLLNDPNEPEEKVDVEGDSSSSNSEESTESIPAIVQRRRTSIEPLNEEDTSTVAPQEPITTNTPAFDKDTIVMEVAQDTEKLTEEPEEPLLPNVGDHLEDGIEKDLKVNLETNMGILSTPSGDTLIQDAQPTADNNDSSEINVTDLPKEEEEEEAVATGTDNDNSVEPDVPPSLIEKCTSNLSQPVDEKETVEEVQNCPSPENSSDDANSSITLQSGSLSETSLTDVLPTDMIVEPKVDECPIPPEIATEANDKLADLVVDTPMDVDPTADLETAIDATPSDSTDSADSNN